MTKVVVAMSMSLDGIARLRVRRCGQQRWRSSPRSWAGSSRYAAGASSRAWKAGRILWTPGCGRRTSPGSVHRSSAERCSTTAIRTGARDPPFHAPVLSRFYHRGQERIDKSGGTSYTFVADGVKAAVEQARAVADGKDVLLAGGVSIARQALAAGLVNEVVLHVVPKLIGQGRSVVRLRRSGSALRRDHPGRGSSPPALRGPVTSCPPGDDRGDLVHGRYPGCAGLAASAGHFIGPCARSGWSYSSCQFHQPYGGVWG